MTNIIIENVNKMKTAKKSRSVIEMTNTLFWVVWWGSFVISVIDLFLDVMERVQRIRERKRM